MAASPGRKKKAIKKRQPRSVGFGTWLRSHAIALMFGGIGIIAAIAVALHFGLYSYYGKPQWIYIPQNASEQSIRDSLSTHLGEGLAGRVMMFWNMQGGSPAKAHGAYLVTSGRSALSLSRALRGGRQSPVKVSFTGVRTLKQLAERATRNLEITPDEFLAACRTELPDRGYSQAQFPAAFLPDSYEFYWTVDARELVRKLTDYRDKFWTDDRKEQALALGLSPVEVATVASIIEEESAKKDERPKIARLYINRLHKGMKLQADPTVKFALGDFSLRRINLDHLGVDSPYNTYRVHGLPPGPIRVPEKSALIAVLEAPKHDYLFMCAKEDFSGYHNFAVDYASHEANAKRYQAELNRRNIH